MAIRVKNIKRGYILTSLSDINNNGDMDSKKEANNDVFKSKNCLASKNIAGIDNKPKKTEKSLKRTSPPPKYEPSFRIRKYSGG